MINLELESKLIRLTKEYDKYNKRYAKIEEEIEDLETELEGLDFSIKCFENQIKSIKNQLLAQKVNSLNIKSEDRFIDSFVKTSFFCNKDDEDVRTMLSYVKITEDKLIGLDGHRAILIKCGYIPDKLKNTYVKWDVRENFEENITEILSIYPDIIKIYEDSKNGYKYKAEGVVASEFQRLFNTVPYEKYKDTEHIELEYDNLKIIFNKEYIDTALMCFEGQEFNVYLRDQLSPLVMENEQIQLLILPVRPYK